MRLRNTPINRQITLMAMRKHCHAEADVRDGSKNSNENL